MATKKPNGKKKKSSSLAARNDEPEEIVAVGEDGDTSWLDQFTGEDDKSREGMAQYRIVPRGTIIQDQSKEGNLERLKEEHGAGAVVLPHSAVCIAGKGEAFKFVPLFFFTQFIQWRDRRDKSGNATIEKTYDPTHIVAVKSRDKKRREEVYDGGPDGKPWKYRFAEHLDFIGYIYDGDYKGEMISISFSRGEFFTGSQFTNQIGMRRVRGKQAPTWSTVWEFRTALRKGDEGNWYGYDIRSNAEQPYILSDEGEAFLGEHLSLREDYKEKRLITVQGEDGDDADVSLTEDDIDDDEV